MGIWARLLPGLAKGLAGGVRCPVVVGSERMDFAIWGHWRKALDGRPLLWRLDTPLPSVPDQVQRFAIQSALSQWARASGLLFRESGILDPVDLRYGFAEIDGRLGGVGRDGLPMGTGRPEVAEGDVTFDSLESGWGFTTTAPVTLPDIDFYSVALHESGHGLGLGHSEVWGSVMHAWYLGPNRALREDDREAIARLYPPLTMDERITRLEQRIRDLEGTP